MHMTPNHTDAELAELRQILVDRQRTIQIDIDERRRLGRANRNNEVSDMVDMSDASIEEEMAFALLDMRATLLTRIEGALARLDAGNYGTCIQCGESISTGRLRALPFAVRCRDCETRVEQDAEQGRKAQLRDGGGTALLPEVRGL